MDDNLISIGWVALDENGNVNQPTSATICRTRQGVTG